MKLENWGIGDSGISIVLKVTIACSRGRSSAFSPPFLEHLLEKKSDQLKQRIQKSSSAKDNALCTLELEIEIRRMSYDVRKWLVPDKNTKKRKNSSS